MPKDILIDLFEDAEFEAWQGSSGMIYIHDLEKQITLDYNPESFERFFLRLEATKMMLDKLEKQK